MTQRERALARSRRNQPSSKEPVYSEWLCNECRKAGCKIKSSPGYFRDLHCYRCNKTTEHLSVVPAA